MTDDELDKLAEQLWKRMEPFARAELERLFTNYMATRTLLEPDLVKKLFEAMEKDLNKFIVQKLQQVHAREREEHLRRMEQYRMWREQPERWKK